MIKTTQILFLLASLFLVITEVKCTDVQIETLTKPEACEKVAQSGDTIAMRYKGNLYDLTTKEVGKQFDSNFDSPQTFDFRLGAGQVIQGWEKGVPGMCVGERRKLIIPPELAYGDAGFTDLIPPKSTLVFEIELVDVKAGDEGPHPPGHKEDTWRAMDADGDGQISKEEMSLFIKKFNDEGAEEHKIEDIDAIVNEIFQSDDKNKDGVISHDEYEMMGQGTVEDEEELSKEEL